MSDQEPKKDLWDKAEIIGKVALPIIIAGATLFYNGQLNQRQRDAAMVEIAVGIVSEDPAEDPSDNALRDWAIERLVLHGNLDAGGAEELRRHPLPTTNVAFEIETELMRVEFNRKRCDHLHDSIDLLRQSIQLKQDNKALATRAGQQTSVTETSIAFDQSTLASAQAQLVSLNCPEHSTTVFLQQVLTNPNSPYYLDPNDALNFEFVDPFQTDE